MASANGHTSKFGCIASNHFTAGTQAELCALDVLNYLLSIIHPAPRELRASTLNVQNASGNTPLHWASLNGHLEAVKILIAAGADPSVTNQAGHDCVYEAEINSKYAVVEWLLTEGKGIESGDAGNEDCNAANDQVDEKANNQDMDQDMGKMINGYLSGDN